MYTIDCFAEIVFTMDTAYLLHVTQIPQTKLLNSLRLQALDTQL